jgi:hypothetical protein
MSADDIDPFTSERIFEAINRDEAVEGFEHLGELLGSFHEPATASEAAATLPAAAVVPARTGGSTGRITRRTGAAAAVALFAFSGAAAALTGATDLITGAEETDAPEEEAESADTDFNVGYDEENQVFVWNTSPRDGQFDCTLENGPITVTYRVDDDGVIVESLAAADGEDTVDVTFPDRDDAEGEPLAYSADSDCALVAAEVAGPNGQVNHGMFMKTFNSLFEGTGRGCVNRFLAQSDLGKGDQQVRVGDVDPDADPIADGATGEIGFETFLADCERDKGKPENPGNGNRPENPGNGNDNENRPENPGNGNGNRPENPGNGNGNR